MNKKMALIIGVLAGLILSISPSFALAKTTVDNSPTIKELEAQIELLIKQLEMIKKEAKVKSATTTEGVRKPVKPLIRPIFRSNKPKGTIAIPVRNYSA